MIFQAAIVPRTRSPEEVLPVFRLCLACGISERQYRVPRSFCLRARGIIDVFLPGNFRSFTAAFVCTHQVHTQSRDSARMGCRAWLGSAPSQSTTAAPGRRRHLCIFPAYHRNRLAGQVATPRAGFRILLQNPGHNPATSSPDIHSGHL